MFREHDRKGLDKVKTMEIDRLQSHLGDALIQPSNRYIVAKVCDRLITFPDTLVAEILIVERNSILVLPFYDAAIIGVVHQQASVMPLLMLRTLLDGARSLVAESLTVIKLSEAARQLGKADHKLDLGGIGVIVDRVIGSIAIDEYIDAVANSSDLGKAIFPLPKLSNIELNDILMTEMGDGSKNSSKKFNQVVANIGDNEYTPIEIVLLNTPTHIWQPQRWQSRGQSLLDRR